MTTLPFLSSFAVIAAILPAPTKVKELSAWPNSTPPTAVPASDCLVTKLPLMPSALALFKIKLPPLASLTSSGALTFTLPTEYAAVMLFLSADATFKVLLL